jgi:hypothetical protein
MTGFIDLQSIFANLCREGSASEWGKRAADRAKAAGKRCDADSVNYWLDQSETEVERQLRSSDRERWQSLRDDAAGWASKHAEC